MINIIKGNALSIVRIIMLPVPFLYLIKDFKWKAKKSCDVQFRFFS
jgi:hypothetical protein